MFAHGAFIILALNSSRFKEIIQYRYDIKGVSWLQIHI